MYYLRYYEKMYEKKHIPIHYVLMVGYDDEKELIYVLDTGRENCQTISYHDLEKALNVKVPGFSKKNTLIKVRFKDSIHSIEDIVYKGFKKKAEFNLNPPAGFIGIRGMKKFIKEFPTWKNDLDEEDFINAIKHLLEYTGFPPFLPLKADASQTKENSFSNAAARNELAKLLKKCSDEYDEPMWKEAATLFDDSGKEIVKVAMILTDFLLAKNDHLSMVPDIFTKIAAKEEKAYQIINDSLKG